MTLLLSKSCAVDNTAVDLLFLCCVCADDIAEANRLMTDLEPTTPQEYILKGVVNAVLGQEHGIVCHLLIYVLTHSSYVSMSVYIYALILDLSIYTAYIVTIDFVHKFYVDIDTVTGCVCRKNT